MSLYKVFLHQDTKVRPGWWWKVSVVKQYFGQPGTYDDYVANGQALFKITAKYQVNRAIRRHKKSENDQHIHYEVEK